MGKRCIFCGKEYFRPSNEHVIPEWLIEMTGDPKRDAVFSFIDNSNNGFFDEKRAFRSFVFPSCVDCNNRYSLLESNARCIVQKILSYDFLCPLEVSILLDWFDKVRIGLWLGYMYLDGNKFKIDPGFYINTRISMSDRMLAVAIDDYEGACVNFVGANTPIFSFIPSAFLLRINKFIFINISHQLLLLRRLGFPFPTDSYMIDNAMLSTHIRCGFKRIMEPVLRNKFRWMKVFQPIYKPFLSDEEVCDVYDDEYVRSHSLNFKDGIGGIFFENESGYVKYLDKDSKICLRPREVHSFPDSVAKTSIIILELQQWIHREISKYNFQDKKLEDDVVERLSAAARWNSYLINMLRVKNKP